MLDRYIVIVVCIVMANRQNDMVTKPVKHLHSMQLPSFSIK